MRGRRPIAALIVLLAGDVGGSHAAGTLAAGGTVKDPSGAVVPGATLSLLTPQGAIVSSARTDGRGAFRLDRLTPGSYLLVVESPGFAARRLPLQVKDRPIEGLELALQPEVFQDEVTVTARPGRADALEATPQRVNVVGHEEVALRAKAVLAQAAAEEVGLHVQRTSPTIGGVYVRGLTGAKVNVYVDGVRYTTSTQRGGISTFLNLVEPEALESVEVLRGPSSAEYGSDALGGSIQLLTRTPTFSTGDRRWSGTWAASLGSADASYGSGVTAAYSRARFGVTATLAGRRVNTLRPGGGIDSRNAVTRFLGVGSRAAIGERLPDTAFTQYGGRLKANWALSPTSQLAAGYLRSQQDGGKRYDQLLGGDGNLVAELRNLMADHSHARWEKAALGPFHRLTLSYSFSAQREERVNQGGNGNPRASINHEPERTLAHGLQAGVQRTLGRHALSLGGDAFFESVAARSFALDPATGTTRPRRGRVPDRARYRHGGVFVQDVFEAVPARLTVNGALRFGAASYRARAADSPLVDGRRFWPDDDHRTSSLTFRLGALWNVTRTLSVAVSASRGFRAPDVTDLGTFGLTGSGYEISSREVAGLGATVGSTADSRAVSTRRPVAPLAPETSLNWELTLRRRGDRFRTDLTAFLIDIDDNIAKQSLVLPPGAVGLSLADEKVVRQLPSGVVFVGASSNPVLARVNFDRARLVGLESTVDWQLTEALFVGGVATFIRAEDRATGRPPNIEGGTPAPDGWLKLRVAPGGGRRFWIEPYLHAALRQERLSTLDLEDRRTGATRSRDGIAGFFQGGARARGLVGDGPDGRPGTTDDVLLATGETLAQVQDRVLGPGVDAAPLHRYLPGYVVVGVRGAIRWGGRHEVLFDLENLGDLNYRGVSWGMDAPGRGAFLRYVARF
jgi:outer membrane receptor protein involved in Fe transport